MIFSEILTWGEGQLRKVPYIAQVHLINIVFYIALFNPKKKKKLFILIEHRKFLRLEDNLKYVFEEKTVYSTPAHDQFLLPARNLFLIVVISI